MAGEQVRRYVFPVSCGDGEVQCRGEGGVRWTSFSLESREVLFQGRVRRMLSEAREMGLELPGERDPDVELWEVWKKRQSFRNKRGRVMMNRFQMCIDRCEKEIQWWSMDAFEREFVGVELDMLRSKTFREKLIAQA